MQQPGADLIGAAGDLGVDRASDYPRHQMAQSPSPHRAAIHTSLVQYGPARRGNNDACANGIDRKRGGDPMKQINNNIIPFASAMVQL
jgi:hypothetical protein